MWILKGFEFVLYAIQMLLSWVDFGYEKFTPSLEVHRGRFGEFLGDFWTVFGSKMGKSEGLELIVVSSIYFWFFSWLCNYATGVASELLIIEKFTEVHRSSPEG